MKTILNQDDVGGLEVENSDGNWISVKPEDGAFVINIGDMMNYFSHGVIKGTSM